MGVCGSKPEDKTEVTIKPIPQSPKFLGSHVSAAPAQFLPISSSPVESTPESSPDPSQTIQDDPQPTKVVDPIPNQPALELEPIKPEDPTSTLDATSTDPEGRSFGTLEPANNLTEYSWPTPSFSESDQLGSATFVEVLASAQNALNESQLPVVNFEPFSVQPDLTSTIDPITSDLADTPAADDLATPELPESSPLEPEALPQLREYEPVAADFQPPTEPESLPSPAEYAHVEPPKLTTELRVVSHSRSDPLVISHDSSLRHYSDDSWPTAPYCSLDFTLDHLPPNRIVLECSGTDQGWGNTGSYFRVSISDQNEHKKWERRLGDATHALDTFRIDLEAKTDQDVLSLIHAGDKLHMELVCAPYPGHKCKCLCATISVEYFQHLVS